MTPEEHLRRIAEVCNQIFLETGMHDRTFGEYQGKEQVTRTLLNQLYNLTSDLIPAEQKHPTEQPPR